MIEILPTIGRWPKAPLGELCDIRGGFPAPQNDSAFEEGEIPFVRMKDVGRHHFTNNLCETEQSLNRAHFEGGRYQLTPRGSILMPRSGSVALNHRAILTVDAVVVSHLCALVPTSDQVTVDFLYRFLCLADMRKLTKKTTGLDSIAFSDLRLVAIPLPPLAEQRRIAEALDWAEALRTKRRVALAQLDSLIQSFFRDRFCEMGTSAKAFPTARLGAVTTFIDYRGISPNKQPSGVRLVTARNIKRGWFEDEPQEFIPADEYVSWMRRGMPRTGDVLFTTEGHTLGSAAQLPHFKKAALAQRLIALQPSERLCSEYLLQVILGRAFQDEVFRRATGSAAQGISSKQLAEILVAVPPIEFQREFARRVRAVEKLKTAQRVSLAEMDALFASLQHRAFRGEL